MRLRKDRINTFLFFQVTTELPPLLKIIKFVKGGIGHTEYDHVAVFRKIRKQFLVLDVSAIGLRKQATELVAHFHLLHLIAEEHSKEGKDHKDPCPKP
jgi:hypothetical protein